MKHFLVLRSPGLFIYNIVRLVMLVMVSNIATSISAREFTYIYEGSSFNCTVVDEAAKTCEIRGGEIGDNFVIPSQIKDGDVIYTPVGIGESAFIGKKIPGDELTPGQIPSSIKYINADAFKNSSLKYLQLPEGVESIESGAFSGENLKYVFLPKSVKRLAGGNITKWSSVFDYNGVRFLSTCQTLGVISHDKVVQYPETAKWNGPLLLSEDNTSLWGASFSELRGDVILPETIKGLPYKFEGAHNIESLILPKSVIVVNYLELMVYNPNTCVSVAIKGNAVYPPGSTYIVGSKDINFSCVFYSEDAEIVDGYIIDNLDIVSCLPKTIGIGNYIANRKYRSIIFTPYNLPESITISDDVEGLFNSFCFHNKKIINVNFPETLRYIVDSFYKCNFADIVLPNNLEMVYNGFMSCYFETEKLEIPSSSKYIYGFDGPEWRYNDDSSHGLITSGHLSKLHFGMNSQLKFLSGFSNSALTTISFPKGIETVGGFRDLKLLKNISFPSSVKSVAGFSSTPLLESFVLPFGVETVYQFNNSGVSSVKLPESVKRIYNCFANCPNLRQLNIPSGVDTVYYDFYSNDELVVRIESEKAYSGSFIGAEELPKVNFVVPERQLINYVEIDNFFNKNLSTPSGLAPLGYSDGIFKYVVFPDSEEAMLCGWDNDHSAIASVPRRIPVETGSGMKFFNVTAIGKEAFAKDNYLDEVVLPVTLKYIGTEAFYGCSKLKSPEFPAELEYIGSRAFGKCSGITSLKFGNELKIIGESAFSACTSLEKVEFENGPEEIPAYCFSGDTSLSDITLPSNLRIIGNYAFQNAGFECVGMPAGLERIGLRSFANNPLTSISIPGSVNSLGSGAFYKCDKINTIRLEDSTTPLLIQAYKSNQVSPQFPDAHPSSIYFGRHTQSWHKSDLDPEDYFAAGAICSSDSLELVEYGNLVENIAYCGFNKNLTTALFGSGVKYIAEGVFSGTSLTQIILPSSIKEIGSSAFYGADIENLTIGCGIEKIGEKAFYSNDRLSIINVTAPESPLASNNTFSYYGGELGVMPGSISSYEDNPICWYRFKSYALIEPKSMSLNRTNITYSPGETIQLSAEIFPAETSLKTILWKSSDPSVAMVDANGLVSFPIRNETGRSMESCIITAYTLYSDSPIAECYVDANDSGINDKISIDERDDREKNIDLSLPYEVYGLNGVLISSDVRDLPKGIYILRQGSRVRKICK